MTDVLVLGSAGRIARHVVDTLGERADLSVTLVQRTPADPSMVPANARVVVGDVLDRTTLAEAVRGQDLVYANLTGDDIDEQAQAVVTAMTEAGVRRLIFVLSLGIYDEVPGAFGEWNSRMIGSALEVFGRAGEIIEACDLDYTIIRPAWLTDRDEVDYETTTRHEPFRGTEVSRRSVAALITRIVADPTLGSRDSLGVDKPGSEGDKPAFM